MHTCGGTALAFVVAASLLNFSDAHGLHHPATSNEDYSFDNIVAQKYPTLPTKLSKYRRQLAEDLTHESGDETIPTCDPKCFQNAKDKKWLSCDDLVRIVE